MSQPNRGTNPPPKISLQEMQGQNSRGGTPQGPPNVSLDQMQGRNSRGGNPGVQQTASNTPPLSIQSPLYFPSDLQINNSKYGDTGLCINMYSDNESNTKFAPVNNTIKDINGKDIQQAKSPESVLNLARNRTKDYQIERQIFLPVPLSLNTNYKIKYKDISATEIAASIGTDIIRGAGSLATTFAKLSNDPRIQLAGKAFDSAIKGVSSLVNTAKNAALLTAATAGVALNPHQEMLLDGVEFRTFQISYNMVAKCVEDSNAIKNIVETLKSGMHPGIYDSNYLFTYPSVFELLLYVKKQDDYSLNKYLFKTKKCALIDLKVQYGKDNFITFKETDAPVEIVVDMTFKEIEILTRDEIEGLLKEGYLTY
jgi:hypothetical protein